MKWSWQDKTRNICTVCNEIKMRVNLEITIFFFFYYFNLHFPYSNVCWFGVALLQQRAPRTEKKHLEFHSCQFCFILMALYREAECRKGSVSSPQGWRKTCECENTIIVEWIGSRRQDMTNMDSAIISEFDDWIFLRFEGEVWLIIIFF